MFARREQRRRRACAQHGRDDATRVSPPGAREDSFPAPLEQTTSVLLAQASNVRNVSESVEAIACYKGRAGPRQTRGICGK